MRPTARSSTSRTAASWRYPATSRASSTPTTLSRSTTTTRSSSTVCATPSAPAHHHPTSTCSRSERRFVMIKYLLVSLLPLVVHAGCGDDGISCCQATPDQYCYVDPSCEDVVPDCEGDGGTTFYVWSTQGCGHEQHEFCALDQADAEAKVAVAYDTIPPVPHGAPSTDPYSTAPTMYR